MKNFLTMETRGDYSPLCQNYLRLTSNKFGSERYLAKLVPILLLSLLVNIPRNCYRVTVYEGAARVTYPA